MKKVFLMATLAVAMVSCGGSKEQPQEEQATTEATTDESAATTNDSAATTAEGNVVNLEATDQMTYNLKEIKVKGGEKVKLTLTDTGKLGKDAMGHNFVLLKQGTDIAAFAQKAMKAKDTDYVPTGDPDVIAHTKLVGGGESTTIEFDAPAPGTYKFICSFPGHYSVMQGDFIVE